MYRRPPISAKELLVSFNLEHFGSVLDDDLRDGELKIIIYIFFNPLVGMDVGDLSGPFEKKEAKQKSLEF